MLLRDMLHPYILVRPKYARGFSTPQYGVRSPNTYPELIALYASAPNHVLGQ